MQADAPWIDVVAGFEVINHPAGPHFGVVDGFHVVQAQCLACAWLVNDQRGNPAPGQGLRPTHTVDHLFGAVEAVDLDKDGHGR